VDGHVAEIFALFKLGHTFCHLAHLFNAFRDKGIDWAVKINIEDRDANYIKGSFGLPCLMKAVSIILEDLSIQVCVNRQPSFNSRMCNQMLSIIVAPIRSLFVDS
jgi:hypothetical protein